MSMQWPRPIRALGEFAEREKQHMRSELSHVRGLLPLLMKRRNRKPWSQEDRDELRVQFRRVSKLSGYAVAFALPGGMILAPALAWWLDQRRRRRPAVAVGPL